MFSQRNSNKLSDSFRTSSYLLNEHKPPQMKIPLDPVTGKPLPNLLPAHLVPTSPQNPFNNPENKKNGA
jgi:hypothetical protein